MRPPKDESKAPPVSSPVWREWSAPLLAFLDSGPQHWKAIHKWRKRVRMNEALMRNCLAWLEEHNQVQCLDDGAGDIRWVSRDWMRRGGVLEQHLSRTAEAEADDEGPSEDALDHAMDEISLDEMDLAVAPDIDGA